MTGKNKVKHQTNQISMRLSDPLYDALEAYCDDRNIGHSTALRQALEQFLLGKYNRLNEEEFIK